MIRAALSSRARLAMLPMLDILALGGEHRMNLPGTTEGNWTWRFSWDQVEDELAPCLRHLNDIYGRLPE
jgi:4-alpha-glucanotransferase